MITETAILEIDPAHEREFEHALRAAVPLFLNAPGCGGVEFYRSLEQAGRYHLVVQWQRVEDHVVHFRGSEGFREWRRLVGGYFAKPPLVEHVQKLALAAHQDSSRM